MTDRRITVARVFTGVLGFQAVIAALLILGDTRDGVGGGFPAFGPGAPRLDAPVAPGDQRRTYRPNRDRPAVEPLRAPGKLPDRLMLTQDSGTTYRLEGAIAPDDAPRVIGLLAEADPAVETLILQSPGGSVSDALVLGRHLRAQGIATKVLRGEVCHSACPYVLAGGLPRLAEEGASIGVHQHYFGESVLLPAAFAAEDIQRGQGEVMTFLIEMGVDPAVMQHALKTPPDQIYVLLPEQLARYRIAPAPEDS